MPTRPRTIKEIQAEKKKQREAEQNKIRIVNLRRDQMVPIQLLGKSSKLVPYQTSIQIGPGKHADLPSSRIIPEQLDNLRKRGFIRYYKVGTPKGNKVVDMAKDQLGQLPRKGEDSLQSKSPRGKAKSESSVKTKKKSKQESKQERTDQEE